LKLVQQKKLHFQDEKSDKIYEVELFHIQEDDYIVNFRYGRRGRKLTEGTKTVFPISKDQADKIFSDLVSSKTKKGYLSVENYGESLSPIPASTFTVEESGAKPVVLSYLKKRAEGQVLSTNWKLSRIIWRSGELRIEEAVPHLKNIIADLSGYELYSAIWTLGRIANDECHTILRGLRARKDDLHYNILIGGLLHCNDKDAKTAVLGLLPQEMANQYMVSDVKGFINSIRKYSFVIKSHDASFLLYSYYLCINHEKLITQFNQVLREIQLVPGYWKYMRYIFKVAEMIEDGRTFGSIAYCIQSQSSFYNKPWGEQIWWNGKALDVKNELASSNSRLAFSNRTKSYLTKRVIKRLRRAGYDRQESYCKFAAGILSSYSEDDQRENLAEVSYHFDRETRNYNRVYKNFTPFSHVPYLYYILYARGDRLKINRYSRFYFDGEEKEYKSREESFPQLWDKYPEYVVQILTNCRARVVMKFTFHFLATRSDVDQLLSLKELVKMIDHPFEEVLEFALKYLEKKYDPITPNKDIVYKLISSGNDNAINLGVSLVDKNKGPFVNDTRFVKAAIITSNQTMHEWLRINIVASFFDDSDQKEIVDATLDYYMQLNEESFNTLSSDSLIAIFETYLSHLDAESIIKMLDHPQLQIQLLGAKLINFNKRKPEEWPEEVLLKMLSSEHNVIREEGAKLLSKLSDPQLIEKESFITSLASSEHSDLRISARNIIGRLTPNYNGFGENVFVNLYQKLMLNYENEEIPKDIYKTIELHLLDHSHLIEKYLEEILVSSNREVHLLLHHYFQNVADLNKLSLLIIAKMGTHDMKAIRDIAFKYYEENIDKVKYHKYDAIRILDTDWEDTRNFAETYFENHFSDRDWEADLIITLCDSIRPKTQEFGTRILGKFFKEESGAKYLTALSEHPDATIQLYTTNYLERYAFNNNEILTKLRPYFIRILSAVNVKRVAKLRVIKFLSNQAKEGKEQALYVADIMNKLVGTIVKREDEAYVEVLRTINQEHPDIHTNIEIIPLEIRP